MNTKQSRTIPTNSDMMITEIALITFKSEMDKYVTGMVIYGGCLRGAYIRESRHKKKFEKKYFQTAISVCRERRFYCL